MSNSVIRVENLSKKYIIGHQKEQGYLTIRDAIAGGTRKLSQRVLHPLKSAHGTASNSEEFWALKDISFDVKQGERLGIIGRNGAGKSTLLKVLSRITEPTSGRATIKGRVSSLLEVGTGFHPELTGRENIYLNGAILGMSRQEILRNFDEIVDFSGVEKFIDTPVKRYSSGMQVRLAFAVAAHLEPEILLVDEVLAVGDAEFQKKCLGKMGEVTQEGRTVLFVSHNLAAIANLCDRCILVNDGHIRSIGITKDVIDYYLSDSPQGGIQEAPGEYELTSRKNPYQQDKLIIRKVRLLNPRGKPQDTFLMGEEMTVVVDVEGLSDYYDTLIGIIFKGTDDQRLASTNTGMTCSHKDQQRQSKERAILRMPQIPFTPGSYWIDISVTRGNSGRIDYVDRAAQFFVAEADVYGTGYLLSANYGVMFLNATWEIRGNDYRDESS